MSPEPVKKPVPRRGRIVLWLAASALALLLAAGWFSTSQTALRWAVNQATEMSGGNLVLEGVEGSVYGQLRIALLTYTTPTKRYEARTVLINWSPAALARRHLQVDLLTVQELRVITLQPSTEPPPLPASLQLPVSLAVPVLQIERIVLVSNQTEQVLSHLVLAIDKPADTYRLKLSRLATPWGEARGELALAETAPFVLSGQLGLTQEGELPYRLAANLTGQLARLGIDAAATLRGGHAEAVAVLTPFDQRPLTEARITLSDIDPARLRKDLPQADIDGLIVLRNTGPDAFAGEVRLDNALAGPWDKSRLPLRSLVGDFVANFAKTAPQQLTLSPLRLDLGSGGSFEGRGDLAGERLSLLLATRNFDPEGILSTMRRMQLAGEIKLNAGASEQTLVADLKDRRNRFQFDLAHAAAQLKVRQAAISAAGSRLQFGGQLALAAPRRFDLAGTLKNFDPAAFGDFPPARINASFDGRGQLAPPSGKPEVALQFSIADSQFRRQPLSGGGKLDLAGQRVRDGNLLLQLASNQLKVHGSFGGPGDQLVFQLAADNLAVITPQLAGRATASGTLEGSFAAPAGRFDLRAETLRWGKDAWINRLQANGRLDQGVDGQIELQALAEGVATPQLKLDKARLTASGRRPQHSITLVASNPELALEVGLDGGWQESQGWSGRLLKLVNTGRHPIALKAPAKLELAPARFFLGAAQFDFAGGGLNVQEASWRDGQLNSQGEFSGLSASYLQQIALPTVDMKTDLKLAGRWRIAAGERVNGQFEVQRQSGDIRLPTLPETALDLQRLNLAITVVDNRIDGRIEAAGTRLGTLKIEAQSQLSRRDGVWGLAGDAPLKGAADFSLASIAWATPLVDKSGALVIDGALDASLRANGSVAHPGLGGTMNGKQFKVELPELGMKLTDGHFQAELDNDKLLLKKLYLRGGTGSLEGEGRLALATERPDLQLTLQAKQLEVLSRPDRLLIVSGSGSVAVADRKIEIAAKLKADRGLFDLPRGDTPTPSKDVVILGGDEKKAAQVLPYAMRLDLGLDLGERFYLKGRGLDAQLAGAVRLLSVDGKLPSATGSIRVEKGTYSAYGQRLEIERGTLYFQGPLDNPGLNIAAMRKNQTVEAGVQIIGSAQTPRVTLVSRPTVPDSEKLSWLVLGRGIDGSSGQDFDALQLAAGALLAAGESITLQQRIAQTTGLEEVSLRGGGTLQTAVLTVGKRISSKAYLSYEHGLAGNESLFKIKYALTRNLSLQTQSGTSPAADIFYTFSFD